MCTSKHYYHVTAIAVNFRCPSTTALWMATRSAHTVNPKEAFSTLQPGNTIFNKLNLNDFYYRVEATVLTLPVIIAPSAVNKAAPTGKWL